MSGITRFSVTPADGALNFTWDVSNALISVANIKEVSIVLSDAATTGTTTSAIQTRSITPTITTNPITGTESIVKSYTWSSLTNGTRYVSSLTISTMDTNGAITTYTQNTPLGLLTPGTVPIKPVFTAYPISTGIRIKLTNASRVASYEPRSSSDGFYGIKQVKYYLSSGTGFETISPSEVLAASLTPDSSLDAVRDARVAYDKEFSIDNLPTDTTFELAITTSNALGDSPISDTLRITTGTAVAEIVPVAVATLEYNRYNKVSATAEVIDASSATILFNQATNTDTLLSEQFPVQSYHIYRQDVSSNGTSLIPFTKVSVGIITSLDQSGNAIGGQGQYNYGSMPYNLTLLDNQHNETYTFKFTDQTAVVGKYYSYTVRGSNSKGQGSEGTNSICRIASRAAAPIITAEPSNNLITLNIVNQALNGYPMFDDASSNKYYFVDVSGVTKSDIVKDASGNVALTSANFNTIVNGGLDKVTVAAITRNPIMSSTGSAQQQDYEGLKSVVNVRPYTNPSAPTGLKLEQIEDGAPISGGCIAEWSPLSSSSRNGNTGAITYTVYVGGVQIVNNLVTPKYRITGLTNGVQYSITVAAAIFNNDLSAQVIGVQSTAATFKPFSLPGPATAVDLSNVSVSLNSLSALWSNPDNTLLYGLGAAEIRYKYELTDMSKNSVSSEETGRTSEKGSITGLVAGTLYKLDVYSGVVFNSVQYYNAAPVTVYKALFTKPLAPVNLQLYPLDKAMRMTWDPAASNGVTMEGYDIYINNGTSSGLPVLIASTGYTMEYFIAAKDGSGNDFVNGTEYKFKVGAKGSVKSGLLTTVDVSGILTGEQKQTPNVGPAAPVISSWEAGEGKATVKWNPIPNASGYLVYQNDDLTSDSVANPAPALTAGRITISPTVVTFEKTGLTNGKTYTFRVVSYITVGSLRITSLEDLQGVKSITPYAQPDLVENLDFTIASETINLTWSTPLNSGGAGLNDNGSLKYKVLITDKSTSPVTIVNQSNLTTTSFSQTGGFINNKAYKVYVYAYYTGKNQTLYTSNAAEIDTVTPNPAPLAISNLTAVAGDHSVKLSWTNPEDGYLYTRTKIAIWKSTNGGAYKLYRISDPTNSSFEDKVGAYRLTDNTTDAAIVSLNYNNSPTANASNSVAITLAELVNGFTYKYKVTSLIDKTSEGAQQSASVESLVVTPSGKPIVDSITYETFTGEYVVSLTSNGSRLKDWLFLGITATATDTPVHQGTVPDNAVGTGNRDTTRQIAGNSNFTIRVPTSKTFDNYLFVINNSTGIEIEVSGAINDTA